MKRFNSLLVSFFFIMLPFLIISFNNSYAQMENESYKEELSYGEKEHYFLKKEWAKGLSEVTQSRQEQPWRKSTWEEQVRYFISQLKKGDTEVFLYADYAIFDGYGNPHTHKSVGGYPTFVDEVQSDGVLQTLVKEATKKNITVKEVLTGGNEKIRINVINSTLKGLLNKDPRVRLIAINFLRRLGPDVIMHQAIKNALILETSTTEWSKLKPKDVDIPSIESPRLGYDVMANKGGKIYNLQDRLQGYHEDISQYDYLNANLKGEYLRKGLYQKDERNDYMVDFYRLNHFNQTYTTRKIWTKSSLLRYGADEKVSGYELQYGLAEKESMPKFVYQYLDYRDPNTGQVYDNLYYAYHSVWEELKKLYLFVVRALWIDKIKGGDVQSVAALSKDSFRTLSDQIDGESIENVPMKSPSFKIFSEDEVSAVIIGLLNNKVVSTREECLIFLKRLYASRNLSPKVRKEIKDAIREARRRELIIDTERGRHLQSELLLFKDKAIGSTSNSITNLSIINEKIENSK